MSVKWTKEEIDILKYHYSTMEREDLNKLLKNRTWKAITNKANYLGLKRIRNNLTNIISSIRGMMFSNVKEHMFLQPDKKHIDERDKNLWKIFDQNSWKIVDKGN